MSPDTVLVLLVRGKPLKALRDAVEKAGGEIRECQAPKSWELPKWAVERGGELGLQLDPESGEGARLAGRLQPAAALARAREALDRASSCRESRCGRRGAAGVGGQRSPGLRPRGCRRRGRPARDPCPRRGARVARRARGPARVPGRPAPARGASRGRAARVRHAGAEGGGSLGGPPWLAKKTIARAKKADRSTLEHALEVFADLEIDLRGGGDLQLDEDTAFSLALARAAG